MRISGSSCRNTVLKRYNKNVEGKRLRIILIFSVAILALALNSCALGNRLDIKPSAYNALKGRLNVILYGCNYNNDLETIAILYPEDGPYVFEPFAPDFNYRVIKGVPAKDALEQAQMFVGCHNAFHTARVSGLVDAKGETLGLEVRPLYLPFVFGMDEVLDVDYRIKDGKVIVKIRLLPSVERMRSDGGELDRN